MIERKKPHQDRARKPHPPKDMGAHPAYGNMAANSARSSGRTSEEDYGNRGLHRQAGSVKAESLQAAGEDAENRDRHWAAKKPGARKGRKVAQGQSIKDRKTIARGAGKHSSAGKVGPNRSA